MSANTWHHVVATGSTSAGELKLYIDGVPVGTDPMDRNLTFNGTGGIGTPTLEIGRRNAGSTNLFDGLIDEVAIYGTALDASTITGHYNAGLVPEPGSLVLMGLGSLAMLMRRRQ